MESDEAFTSAAVVPERAESARCVHGPVKLVAVSTAMLLGPVLLLRKFELIVVIVKL